jgi:hypothetical protein
MTEDRRRPFLPGSAPMTREESIREVHLAISRAQVKAQQKEAERDDRLWIIPEKSKALPPQQHIQSDDFSRAAERYYRRQQILAELKADHEVNKILAETRRAEERIEKETQRKLARLSKERALKAIRDADAVLKGTKYDTRRSK